MSNKSKKQRKPGRGTAGASIAHMVAVAALRMIEEDPELIGRLQEQVRKEDLSRVIKPESLDESTLSMIELAVSTVGKNLLEFDGPVDEFSILVPRGEGHSLWHSAGAMAVGSFATEYIRTDPERCKAFGTWMAETKEQPDAQEMCTPDRLEAADDLLTLMAHAAGHMVEAGVTGSEDIADEGVLHIGPEQGDSFYEPRSRDSYGPHKGYHDDGTRRL